MDLLVTLPKSGDYDNNVPIWSLSSHRTGQWEIWKT